MRYKLICLFLLLGFGANAQYLHMLERADSSSRKVVVTNNSGIQRYVELDSLATLLGVNDSVDSLAIVQDTILVYFRSGVELGRDTIGTYNRSQIDAKDALRVLYTDTAAMLESYITEVEVDSADALRVLYTDTASMLSSYTRRTELQDTASVIRTDLGADIGAKTDTTTFNGLELVYNPNSQPILNKHYREVDKQTIYIEEVNNAAQGLSRLLNTTLSSGRNAYQDAEVVWMADNSDSTITYSNKGADFALSRNANIYGKDNEGAWFEWMQDYPNIDFQENKQKAGLRLFGGIDYGFYRSRVEADTGTLYSIDTCTQNKIDMSLSSSITMIPDGAKAGKLYSIFPNDGSGDFDVTRATTATRVNEDGLIEEVAANVPRIDHTNGCPDLLIEPQRTNLVTYSEEFDNAVWILVRANAFGSGSIINNAVAPDGTLTADYIQSNNTQSGGVFDGFALTNGIDYTWSIFAKKAEHRYLRIGALTSFSVIDLQTGIITDDNPLFTTRVEAFDDGWYRCSITFQTTSSPSSTSVFAYQSNSPTANSSTVGDGIYIWGAQLEAGSYPTSYIPTEGTTVTRNADEIELTGAADLLGDSEGTLFVEASVFENDTDTKFISLSDGSSDNRIDVRFKNNGDIQFTVRIGASTVSSITTPYIADTTYKIAAKYANNNFMLWVNGVEVGSDNLGSTFSSGVLTDIKTNDTVGNSFYGNVKQLSIFPTALTNTQLENITQ